MEPETTGQQQAGKFQKGQSGNPAGRPRGSRHKSTLALEELLDAEGEIIIRKVIELALAGDSAALRLCTERLLPPRRELPVTIPLPAIKTAEDAAIAISAILEVVSIGEILPADGVKLAGIIEKWRSTYETKELAERIAQLEELAAKKGK